MVMPGGGPLGGYVEKMRMFSRNARLYIVHIVGMDVIGGTWEVLFNLYLLAIGFDIAFIGLRLLIGNIVGAFSSVPAGMISDRIGRRASFILGDGGGAIVHLINITTVNPVILLVTPAFSSTFGRLHHVTEDAFMAENTQPAERVHLFSFSDGTRILAAFAGAMIGGLFPGFLTFLGDKVSIFRVAVSIGLGGWFLSLIPAIMLKEIRPTTRPRLRGGVVERRNLRSFFVKNIKHPETIRKLVIANAPIAAGAAFVVPLFNAFFQEGPLRATEFQIGVILGLGSLFLAFASYMAPALSRRMDKVTAVFVTRMMSLPFILVIAFAPSIGGPFGIALLVAGIGFILRITLFNMAGPLYSTFSMEILDRGERASYLGLEGLVASVLAGAGVYLGSQMMNSGDFVTPFVAMAVMYVAANLLFLSYFKGTESVTASSL